MNITKIISTKTEEGVRKAKVLRLGNSDIQEVNESSPFGFDSNPPKDLIAVYGSALNKGSNVLLGYINRNQISEVGEVRLYSLSNANEVSAFAYLKADGTIEFNGDGNFLTKYNELEVAFNQLKNDFNSLVSAYNSHTHTTTATIGGSPTLGIISPTISSSTPSTADISGARADRLKTA